MIKKKETKSTTNPAGFRNVSIKKAMKKPSIFITEFIINFHSPSGSETNRMTGQFEFYFPEQIVQFKKGIIDLYKRNFDTEDGDIHVISSGRSSEAKRIWRNQWISVYLKI